MAIGNVKMKKEIVVGTKPNLKNCKNEFMETQNVRQDICTI